MSILQISTIQHRRGYQQDLPQLATAELGWSIDTRRLFIGNGTLAEGAPQTGVTEILTQFSDLLGLANSYSFEGLAYGSAIMTGPSSISPIQRSLQAKLDDFLNVKDFGAIGDGMTDDTAAIQRALNQFYPLIPAGTAINNRKIIYFPAGKYRISATLKIPALTYIQGEGKGESAIIGNFNGPLATLADSNGSIDASFGMISGGLTPYTSEYIINDVAFLQQYPLFTQSCVKIVGGSNVSFTRVMFSGLLTKTTADGATNVYNTDRGNGVSAVAINQNSASAINGVKFTNCDFLNHNYGAEINGDTTNVRFDACNFDKNYHHVNIGNNSPSTKPVGVALYGNYFNFSAMEGVKTGANIVGVMSLGNQYVRTGMADFGGAAPIVNPSGIAQSAAISFGADNNFSVSDYFNRTAVDYQYYPNVATNGFNCYQLTQEVGLVNGQKVLTGGKTVTLNDSITFTSAQLQNIPQNYNALKMDYKLFHNGQQRCGTMTVTRTGATAVWDESYTETGITGVTFQANVTTGDIEYTSTVAGNATVMSYNFNYFM